MATLASLGAPSVAVVLLRVGWRMYREHGRRRLLTTLAAGMGPGSRLEETLPDGSRLRLTHEHPQETRDG